MKKESTISIGILAYNEEKTISHVLKDVYAQDFGEFTLKEVIVFSDGSDDNTVPLIKSLKYKKLVLIDSKERKGMATGLNALCKNSSGDCLIILNSDIRIKDNKCMQKLAGPIIEGVADLTSCDQVPFKPTTVVEQALVTSMEIKTAVFESYLNGNNVYTCHGTARAFSKKLYQKISFSHSVGEDAYSYLFAAFNKLPYYYVKDTEVFFRLPTALEDHNKQTKRFNQSKTQFVHEFGESFVKKMYDLPQQMIIRETLKKAFTSPFSTALFVIIFFLTKIKTPKEQPIGNTWDIAMSSKETE